MRIISGKAKGRTLVGPKSHAIRPALDQVKEAVFNILQEFRGASVLDLFAGTGSVGLEALSRGADHAVFVDSGVEALKLIRKNISLCRFEERSVVLRRKLPEGLKTLSSSFDFIFVDPPYDKDLVHPTLKSLVTHRLLKPKGWVIVEHSPREIVKEGTGLTLVNQRKYGQTLVSFFTE